MSNCEFQVDPIIEHADTEERLQMKIALGTDHAGYCLKQLVKEHLVTLGHEVCDFGSTDERPVDYPDFVYPAAVSVGSGECDIGIVFGGSGNGEAMVANKVSGVRCGVCWDVWSARMTKAHNNANMIAIGGRVVSEAQAIEIVDAWLSTEFDGGRHLERIVKIELSDPK